MTGIEQILHLVDKQSATDYATSRVIDYRKDKESLYAVYAKSDDEPMEEVEGRCFTSYLKRYADHIIILVGFYELGRVFVIDKRNKVVYFLCGNKDGMARLIPHYNPLNVDVIECSTRIDRLLERVDPEWDYSKDELAIIKELNTIIND